jgi:ubiquinone/menaquinone biosynthesis C-methylase UbiE
MRGIEQIPLLYDAMMTAAEATGFGAWRRDLVADARGRVLDVGCGTGRNLPLYPPRTRVVAVDLRIELLLAARRRRPDAPLVIASAEALPFAPGTFDTVVSGLVFCSVASPLCGLREVRRVLDRDGRLRMLEHVRSTVPLMAWWQDRIQPAWTWVSGGCHPNRDTESTVAAAGFEIERDGRRARRNVRLFSARPHDPVSPA